MVAQGEPIQELACLFARAYLRLIDSQLRDPEIAQDSCPQNSAAAMKIGVDVAGEKMAQLPMEERR